MKFSNVFGIIALLCVWILLMESVSMGTILSGIIFSVLTLLFCNSTLPLGEIDNIKFYKLALYPLYLVGQVYMAGFYVVKLIFTHADVEVVKVKTQLKSEPLRIMLADSLTLTPGSTLIKLKDKNLTVLWLKGKADAGLTKAEKETAIKGSLEKWLLRAEV